MRIYLASWFASKNKIKKKAEILRSLGFEVTSRWLEEKAPLNSTVKSVSEEYLAETARVDIEDILSADVLVLFTPSKKDLKKIPKSSWARGGRNFEAGFMYGLMVKEGFLNRGLVICGPKENVFAFLPCVEHVKNFKQLVAYLNEYYKRTVATAGHVYERPTFPIEEE